MALATGADEICVRLRQTGSDEIYWLVESALPIAIAQLMDGEYAGLPHAQAFGRHLRRRLLAYLEEARDYVLELEELSEMANNLTVSGVDMPPAFIKAFDRAAEESVDTYDLEAICRGTDPAEEIGEPVDQMAIVDAYNGSVHVRYKRREFEERLDYYGWLKERQPEREARSPAASRPARAARVEAQSSRLSNADLGAMFSSLRKPD